VRNVPASFYFSAYSDIQIDTFEFVTGFIQTGKQKISLNIERMNRGAYIVYGNNEFRLDREFVNLGSSEVLNEKMSIYIEYKINNENYILDITEANLEIRYYKKTLMDIFLERFVYPHVRIF
jgi:poly(3-hydroxyalkanoate) synthetase